MNCVNNCNYRANTAARVMPVNELCHVHNSNDLTNRLPLAMAYVPKQHYEQLFDLSKGLKMGTIFPELCLPFCGQRRNCSCKTTR